MGDYLRVATFEASGEALDALVREIDGSDGPPPGVPASRITVLADRANGRVVVAVRFGSEADLRTGAATLETMSPPDDAGMRRIAVDEYEVVLERSGG